MLVDASRTTGVVMFLCGAATAASYMITLANLPSQLAQSMGPLLASPVAFMAVVCLFLLAVGMVMDLTPTILILGPVLAPLAAKAGIDPVYFGFMFIYVGCIGLITPPVGTVQNVVAGVGRLRMETVIKGTTPFLLMYVLLAVLFVLFPSLITAPLAWMH
ncbi:C4-dicarboxylate TRAP transporter large permease protein DctM [compost metagenome]